MVLYEIVQSLGLKCLLVPIITLNYGGYYDDGPCHLFQSTFYGLNGGRGRGSAELDEFECWGHEMPNGKVTWLNPDIKAKKGTNEEKQQSEQRFKEVQLAYMTVSES